MALPYHVGDDVNFREITLKVADKAECIVPGEEPHENVIGFILVAHPDNTARVYVGDSNSQPLPIGPSPLANSPSMEFKLTRRKPIWIKGAKGDKVILVTVMTSGCIGQPRR